MKKQKIRVFIPMTVFSFFVIAEHTNYYANAKSIALEQLQEEQSAADIALTALSGIKPKEKSKRKYIREYTFPHL